MGLQSLQLGSQSPQQKSSKSLIGILNTGFSTENYQNTDTGFVHNDKPVVNTQIQFIDKSQINEDSILESVDTGFGNKNTLIKDCPKPKFKTPMYEENYLSEFNSESEKKLARYNLGVYSKDEVSKIVADIVGKDTETFITRQELEEKLAGLDFVDSELKGTTSYEIPDKLFKI